MVNTIDNTNLFKLFYGISKFCEINILIKNKHKRQLI